MSAAARPTPSSVVALHQHRRRARVRLDVVGLEAEPLEAEQVVHRLPEDARHGHLGHHPEHHDLASCGRLHVVRLRFRGRAAAARASRAASSARSRDAASSRSRSGEPSDSSGHAADEQRPGDVPVAVACARTSPAPSSASGGPATARLRSRGPRRSRVVSSDSCVRGDGGRGSRRGAARSARRAAARRGRPREQLVVRAVLDDPALVDHEDQVGVDDRRQPVRDHERRPADHQPLERVEDDGLGPRVDRRRRLVEDQDRRVA